jgi:hypothetical protein
LLADANISKKHTAPIFRAQKMMLGSGGIYAGMEEGKAKGVVDQWLQGMMDSLG